MILGMGVPELLLILVVVLLIFGPKNLPKLGKSLGKTVKNVREGMEEGGDDKKDEDVVDMEPEESDANIESDASDGEDYVFCNKCGTKNPVDSAFCKKCGAKLN